MLLDEIREELDSVTPKLTEMPAHLIRKVSSKYYQKVKGFSKQKILDYCEELLKSGKTEERTIAFDWGFRLKEQYEPDDYFRFESKLKKYVHGWGGCDDLCTHAFGAFIHLFPRFIPKVKDWTKTENTWMRRASAVVLIYSVRRKKHLRDVFEIADLLLKDSDVMVQKGYGWMLKEASKTFAQEVFDYVMTHRMEMPRTALRYAIEKLPTDMRRKAMKKQG